MNFELSDEQRMVRDSLSRLLADRYGFEQRNRYRALPGGFDPDIWRAFAGIGLTALNVPEACDGLGAGVEETFIVMAELGRALCVEPFMATCVMAPVLLQAGSGGSRDGLLRAIASGDAIVAFAHMEHGQWSGEAQGLSTARQVGDDGWQLNGVKSLVRHGAQADVLIVSARTDGETGLFLVAGEAATRRDFETQDGMRAAEVVLENAPAERLTGAIAAEQAIARAEAAGLAAACAEAVGCMDKALELTGEYLKTREQFGRAIGSFQALQHAAADIVIEVEQARSMALYAAMMAGADDARERDAALSAAKVQVCRSARAVGQAAVQLHGGVGMTMEYAIGHYFKRLTMIELEFGGLDFHLDRLSALGGLD